MAVLLICTPIAPPILTRSPGAPIRKVRHFLSGDRMRAAITADFLRRLPAGPCEIWDTKLTGLRVRVRESGRAYWTVVLGRGVGGKETLGRVDLLTPAEARELAQTVLGQASKDRTLGADPRAARRRRRAKANAGTLKDFLTTKYAPWAAANRKTGNQTVARITAAFGHALLNRPMVEVTTFGVEQWRTSRRRAGLADSTINRDLDALRGVLSKAIEWGVLTDHPMRQVRRAKTDTLGRVRYLTRTEERRLRESLAERDEARREGRRRFNTWRTQRGYRPIPEFGKYPDHLTPVVTLALNTGLRRGELLALEWSAVDLANRRLVVRGASAKSGLTRHVPLNDEAHRVLTAWQPCSASESLVFPGPKGEPMADLKTAWGRVAKAAALDDFTFHDLRHTFASNLVQAGVDLNTVRELLGHSDIRMTLRYAHLAPEHKAAAVAKLVQA
jgi:integrase